MNKQIKRMLSTFENKVKRNQFKNLMVDAMNPFLDDKGKKRKERMVMMYEVPKPAGYTGI